APPSTAASWSRWPRCSPATSASRSPTDVVLGARPDTQSRPGRSGQGPDFAGEGFGAVAVVLERAEARRGRGQQHDAIGLSPAISRRDGGGEVRAVVHAREPRLGCWGGL